MPVAQLVLKETLQFPADEALKDKPLTASFICQFSSMQPQQAGSIERFPIVISLPLTLSSSVLDSFCSLVWICPFHPLCPSPCFLLPRQGSSWSKPTHLKAACQQDGFITLKMNLFSQSGAFVCVGVCVCNKDKKMSV